MTNTNKNIMDTTDNNSIYNKTRKEYLERKGLIHCSWCAYHHGENEDNKYYGTLVHNWRDLKSKGIRYPNWKLISRNEKQWMEKPLIIKKKNYRFFEDYYSLEF